MKYKKHIATGALAITLLVSGSSVYASTPQDLGIKNTQKIYQKQEKNKDSHKKHNRPTVGIVSALTNSGFTISVTDKKNNTSTSVDVVTDSSTIYQKDGLPATSGDVVVGQKVIVKGVLDKTTNILTATKVKIVTNSSVHEVENEGK